MVRLTKKNASEILTSALWRSIISYMDDDIREDVHGDLAPCTHYEFLMGYLQCDPDFTRILEDQFSVTIG